MNTDKIYAEQLANEYAPKDTSKVVALRKLDKKAKLPANIFTYSLGILSALVFGIGMCLEMRVIGSGSTALLKQLLLKEQLYRHNALMLHHLPVHTLFRYQHGEFCRPVP